MSEMSSSTSSSPSGVSPLSSPDKKAKGRGRGRGYTKESERSLDYKPLRRPETGLNDSQLSSSGVSDKSNNIVLQPNDTISREPSLFNTQTEERPPVPRFAVSDGQVTWKNSNLNADAVEFVFVPRATFSQPNLSPGTQSFTPPPKASVVNEVTAVDLAQLSLAENIQHTNIDEIITRTEEVLIALLSNPGDVQNYMQPLACYLQNAIVDEAGMTALSDVVFEWAVGNTNFSYTCMLICDYLKVNIPSQYNGTFIQHMLKRCRLEHIERKQLMKTNSERLRNFTIFMAELYTRRNPISPNRNVELKLMNAIFELLETLLTDVTDENAKTVSQTLKLCGGCLEDDLIQHENSSQRMQLIMNTLQTCNKANLKSHLASMLENLVQLRASNWGRATPSPLPSPTVNSTSPFTNEPIFYTLPSERGQRQQPISREEYEANYGGNDAEAPSIDETAYESELLSSNPVQWSNGTDGASGDAGYDDDDLTEQDIVIIADGDENCMTDEMVECYEEFLSQQRNQH